MLTQHTTVFFVRLPCISIPYPAKKSPTAVFGCFGFYKADDDARLTPCKEDNAVKGKTHNISGRFGYLLLRYLFTLTFYFPKNPECGISE